MRGQPPVRVSMRPHNPRQGCVDPPKRVQASGVPLQPGCRAPCPDRDRTFPGSSSRQRSSHRALLSYGHLFLRGCPNRTPSVHNGNNTDAVFHRGRSFVRTHNTGLRLNHCFSSLRFGRMNLPLRGRWPSEARSDEVVSLLLFCAQYLIRRLRATPSPRGKAGAGLPESSSQRYALDGNEYKLQCSRSHPYTRSRSNPLRLPVYLLYIWQCLVTPPRPRRHPRQARSARCQRA